MLKEFIFKDRKVGEVLSLKFEDADIDCELVYIDSSIKQAIVRVDRKFSIAYNGDIDNWINECGIDETLIWDISYINDYEDFIGFDVIKTINRINITLEEQLKNLGISIEDFEYLEYLKEIEKLINKN